MNDYMLKFTDQQEAESVLIAAGVMQMFEEKAVPVMGHAVDVIGKIYKPDGTYRTEENGFKIPNFEELEGYHVNVRSNGQFETFQPYIVTPTTPYRVWA
jgi:hypothetical protein